MANDPESEKPMTVDEWRLLARVAAEKAKEFCGPHDSDKWDAWYLLASKCLARLYALKEGRVMP